MVRACSPDYLLVVYLRNSNKKSTTLLRYVAFGSPTQEVTVLLTRVAEMSLVAARYWLNAAMLFCTESDASLSAFFTAPRGSITWACERYAFGEMPRLVESSHGRLGMSNLCLVVGGILNVWSSHACRQFGFGRADHVWLQVTFGRAKLTYVPVRQAVALGVRGKLVGVCGQVTVGRVKTPASGRLELRLGKSSHARANLRF